MLAVLSVSFVIWAFSIYELVTDNYVLFIVGTALLVVTVLAWSWFENRKLKSFRSQWGKA